jgi:hypothetical protein
MGGNFSSFISKQQHMKNSTRTLKVISLLCHFLISQTVIYILLIFSICLDK